MKQLQPKQLTDYVALKIALIEKEDTREREESKANRKTYDQDRYNGRKLTIRTQSQDVYDPEETPISIRTKEEKEERRLKREAKMVIQTQKPLPG